MLVGEYKYKVEAKNRVSLPKKFREEIGNKIVVTRGYEGCLVVVSPKQWRTLIEDAAKGPFVAEEVRDTSRFLLGGAVEAELDDLGRFVVPSNLREYAQIEKEVCFLGLGRWVEIWAAAEWEKRKDYIKKHSGAIGRKLAKLEVTL
jgi:MraZ protein